MKTGIFAICRGILCDGFMYVTRFPIEAKESTNLKSIASEASKRYIGRWIGMANCTTQPETSDQNRFAIFTLRWIHEAKQRYRVPRDGPLVHVPLSSLISMVARNFPPLLMAKRPYGVFR